MPSFIASPDLYEMVDKAERQEDAEIKVYGLEVGQRYHIRPLIHTGNERLPTGDYTITDFEFGSFAMGEIIRFQKKVLSPFNARYFKVEGIDDWFRFDEMLIFTHTERIEK